MFLHSEKYIWTWQLYFVLAIIQCTLNKGNLVIKMSCLNFYEEKNSSKESNYLKKLIEDIIRIKVF